MNNSTVLVGSVDSNQDYVSTTAGVAYPNFETTADFLDTEDPGDHIFACVLTILFVLGLCWNTLGAMVLKELERKMSGVRLLKYLTFVDIAALVMIFLDQVITFFNGIPRSMILIMGGMKTVTFPIGMTVYTFEIYFTMLIAFQRAFVLAYPLRSSVYMRKSAVNKVMLILALFAIVFNIPYWIIYKRELYYDNELQITWITASTSDFALSSFYFIYDGYITLVFRAIIPMAVLTVCNVIIIVSARKQMVRQSGTRNNEHLAAVNVAIISMSLVTHVTTAVERITGWSPYFPQISTSLVILNCSSNFIFYCAFGRSFRKALVTMFQGLRASCRCVGVLDDDLNQIPEVTSPVTVSVSVL